MLSFRSSFKFIWIAEKLVVHHTFANLSFMNPLEKMLAIEQRGRFLLDTYYLRPCDFGLFLFRLFRHSCIRDLHSNQRASAHATTPYATTSAKEYFDQPSLIL